MKKSRLINIRIRTYEDELIINLVKNLQKVSDGFEIDRAKLIRGVLLMASKQKPKEVLKYIKTAHERSIVSGL